MKINLKNVSIFNLSFGEPKDEKAKDHRPSAATLAGKAFAHDILVAGAVLHACPRIEDSEELFGAARDFAIRVADALKEKGNTQKLVDNFLLGANDTINRVSGIVCDPDEES